MILDATFSKRGFRDRLRESLGDSNLRWIIAETDEATVLKRLQQREWRTDLISDARSEDFGALNAAFEIPDELPDKWTHRIDTTETPDEALRRLLVTLATDFREPDHLPEKTD
jgi:predicted kinase